MILDRVLTRIAGWLTHLLNTDSLAAARARELAGKVFALNLTGIETSLFIALDDNGMVLATTSPRAPDVTLSGSVSDFVAFVHARQTQGGAPAGKLQIQGDLSTAQQLQRLLDQLDIDWEELLAMRIGDVAAHQIGRGVRGARDWFSTARVAFEEDLTAFLQQERRIAPSPREAESFVRAGATLAADVDRLAARVAQLRARKPPP